MLYLEEPSIKRKEDILSYLDEFDIYNSDINGAGDLDKVYYGYTFEEALYRCLKMRDEEYARSLGRCQAKTFLLIRENDNKIIGTINIRWNLTKEVKRFGGNIGYSIRPTERRKGYNKINLYLGLLEAKKIGLDKIMLDCSVTNIGSDKTIKALGGVLERSEIDPYDGELTNVYWIDVNKSINKYSTLIRGDNMNLYLREINSNDKDELLKMVKEIENDIIEDKYEGFRNIEGLTKDNFNNFLEELEKNKNMKLYKPYLVDQTTYILVDNNNHIYGGTNIRHELNDNLLEHGGHVGYLIRPSERKKGYGTYMLRLILDKCKLFGINRVLVTCREDNIASSRVILNNGGIYEDSRINKDNNKLYRRYWINNK